MDYKANLEKLRALPESRKKIILWSIVGIIAVVLLFFWVKSTQKSFSELQSEFKFSIPSLAVKNNEEQAPQTEPAFTIWPDADTFDSNSKTFEAKDLDTQETLRVTTDLSTKFYKNKKACIDASCTEQVTVVDENYDFESFYNLLKNWEGPSWRFTLKGTVQSDGSVIANEIFYQIQ